MATAPLSLGPAWLRALGHANPLYYSVQASRSLAAGSLASGTVAAGFAVTGGVAVLAVCWWTRACRRAMA